MTKKDSQSTQVEGVHQILTAARFAAERHVAQRRKGQAGEPYINHLIEVAELLAGSGPDLDVNLVMAGFLHDTIEDTGVTAEELRTRFGDDVTALVLEATDDKTLPKKTRKALQIKNAPHKSVRAQALKLADKISNLRSLLNSPPADWSQEDKRDYCEWARQVVLGFPSPNPVLVAQFNDLYERLAEGVS